MKPMKWMVGILLSMTMFTGVHAEETGSLTLQCHINGEEGKHYFAGDTYAILPVADLVLDEGNAAYVMREDFASFDCDWNTVSASELKDMAEEMVETADFSTALQAASNADGEVYFSNLEPALYLIDRVGVAEGNEAYSVDPMLISVPSFSDNAWIYDVVITPKFSELPQETEEPKEPDTQLPATGQLKWPIPVLAVGGAVLIGSGLFLSIRRKEEGKTDQPDSKE